jgi:predicted transcriptional regulator
MCGMKKTTLYLEPELDRAVGRLAASRGVSRAQAIRTALRAATGQLERPRITAIGVARGPVGVTDNIDRHLAETGFGEA